MRDSYKQEDLLKFIPRLKPDVLAKFEEVSGLFFVNATREEMFAAGEPAPETGQFATANAMFEAINHETYHYFQLVATGYQFRHASDVWRAFWRSAYSFNRRQLFHERIDRLCVWLQGWILPRWYLEWWGANRQISRWKKLIREGRDFAKPGDHSVYGHAMPKLYRRLDALQMRRRAASADGLSALHLIEGSAVVYQYALTYGASDWRGKLDAEWSAFDDTYRRAFSFARAIAGERAYDVILPAVALSLRYERPAEAYPWFVSHLSAAPAGQEIAAARVLAESPPALRKAGRYLGTARDVRRKKARWSVLTRWVFPAFARYDKILAHLRDRTWDVDELDLLVDPSAAEKVAQADQFGFIARDSPIFVADNAAGLIAKLQIASIFLRSVTLPGWNRELEAASLKLQAQAIKMMSRSL